MVTAVLFDLYETLVTERHTTPVRASSLGERLGLDAAAFREAWNPQRVRVICGEMSFAAALLEIGAMLGRRLDAALIRDLSAERRVEKAALLQRFDPVAFEVLRGLRNRGCRLAVISNCFAEDVAAWPRFPAAECFDTSVFSFEVGSAKPEPHIYLEAARRLEVEPSECVAIEDSDAGILAASRAGMLALLVPDLKIPSGQAIAAAFRVLGSLTEACHVISTLIENGKSAG